MIHAEDGTPTCRSLQPFHRRLSHILTRPTATSAGKQIWREITVVSCPRQPGLIYYFLFFAFFSLQAANLATFGTLLCPKFFITSKSNYVLIPVKLIHFRPWPGTTPTAMICQCTSATHTPTHTHTHTPTVSHSHWLSADLHMIKKSAHSYRVYFRCIYCKYIDVSELKSSVHNSCSKCRALLFSFPHNIQLHKTVMVPGAIAVLGKNR